VVLNVVVVDVNVVGSDGGVAVDGVVGVVDIGGRYRCHRPDFIATAITDCMMSSTRSSSSLVAR
jgi:hypothetical protein